MGTMLVFHQAYAVRPAVLVQTGGPKPVAEKWQESSAAVLRHHGAEKILSQGNNRRLPPSVRSLIWQLSGTEVVLKVLGGKVCMPTSRLSRGSPIAPLRCLRGVYAVSRRCCNMLPS